MKLIFVSIFLFSFAEAQWTRVPEIPGNRMVYTLLVVHDTLYAGTDSVVYVGLNGGSQWFAGAPPAGSPDIVGCMLKHGNTLIVGMFQNGIFRSTNDGLSWQSFSSGLAGLGALDVSNLLIRRDSLIAGTFGAGVFTTSADFSHPWSSWGDSIVNYQGDNVYKMLSVGNTVFACAGTNGYVFRYADTQPWWNPIPIHTPRPLGPAVTGMAAGSAVALAGMGIGIYRSSDDGLSWEPTTASIPPSTFATFLTYQTPIFFAATITPFSSSLLRSSDAGITWQSLGTYPLPGVLSIAVVGETVYLGRQGGLWRAPLSGLVTTVGERETTPLAFSLQQNYPNPFNPSTTISFSLPSNSFVSLKVFDALGREVASVVDEEVSAGSHFRTWNAKRLSSGIYFYRLQAGFFTETKKLVVLQ